MRFERGNNWIDIHHAHPDQLRVFDLEFRYPTPAASPKAMAFRRPDTGQAWDGWVRLLREPAQAPPRIPAGLLDRLERLCQHMGYQYELRDIRVRPELGMPELVKIELRDYQDEACTLGVRAGCGVLDMPPRSGKTRTMCELHRRIALPLLWVVPTDQIAVQTYETIKGFFGDYYAVHLKGSRAWEEASKRQVVVCTAATAVLLPQAFFDTRHMLCVDEWHHGAAKSYWDIVMNHCEHIYFRYAMTGTFFRSGEDEMAMHALLSTTLYQVSSQELLRRGLLVPTSVLFLPVHAPKLRGYSGMAFMVGHGKHGIHEHQDRNKLAAYAAALLAKAGRKVLVMVGVKAQGVTLQALIESLLPPNPQGTQFRAAEYVSTDVPRSRIRAILEAYNGSDEVKVLIGTSLVGEGVDLPSTDALVYARGERAEVTLTQNAYRVCTAIEGKRDAVIVDFADRHHRKLLSHSLDRLNVYYNDPVFSVQVLQDASGFVRWLRDRGAPEKRALAC